MLPVLAVYALVTAINPADSHRISCYYRYNHRGLLLDPDILKGVDCSHIIFGFATVTSDLAVNLSSVGERDGLRAIVQQIRAPGRKVMLSIGGGGGDNNFDQMTATRASVTAFVTALVELVRDVPLDGVDYDWEFPSLLQLNDFSRLLNKTREALDDLTGIQPAGSSETLDLSVALPGPFSLTAGYDIDVLKRTCTFFNVMTYDLVLYSSWRPVAAFHNALYGQGNFLNPLRLFSVEVSMENWVNLGLPANKLLLGLPTYGVAYQLKNPRRTAPLSVITGYSHLGSNLNHDEVCRIISAYPQGNVFDEQSRVPYATDNNGTWVSYDNVRSIVEKVLFSVQRGYGGIMIFSLNADDPFGDCSASCSQESDACIVRPADRSNGFPLTRVAIATLNDALNTTR